ncbi:ATP synthase subunit B [Halolactibacillus miurensis]|uniref:ATP synthase subunit B n=1 Tax=Halolactibacillus miurensis TaxID=306541 RepID=A0A1I6TUX3_9BACI|nr:hypothetical protein [Halolactibacillus miurensis]GEM05453.1 ATP synthase subunit B [Halolactibacillus miurensis]SFS93043.1 Polyhydroxyalkanoate synthesis regulator phasin [Halolactibacillus miurensis]
MADLFKKGLAVGLGLAQTGVEQAEKVIHQLVEKGDMTKAEAKEFFDKYYEKGEDTQNKTLNKLNIATKEDVKKIEARLAVLEQRLNDFSREE